MSTNLSVDMQKTSQTTLWEQDTDQSMEISDQQDITPSSNSIDTLERTDDEDQGLYINNFFLTF